MKRQIKVTSLFQMRDLKAVGKKFVHVMYPKKSSALLRDCMYKLMFKILSGCFANMLCVLGKEEISGTGGIQKCLFCVLSIVER